MTLIDVHSFMNLHGVYNLIMGIYETVVLSHSTDAKHVDCDFEPWYCILTLCVLRWICVTVSAERRHSERKGVWTVEMNSVYLVWIWALVNFHASSDDCKNMMQDQFTDLWNFIVCEAVTFYVMLMLTVFHCVSSSRTPRETSAD